MPPRPPYRLAVLAAALVLTGYVITLAPTVTFWDAGEFIAAAKTLGIPHPPGTPLFTLIAHVWGTLVPVGEYAVRLNLLSALLSAAGAGCFFLVVHESLTKAGDQSAGGRLLRVGGSFAAILIAAFTFTVWQNSNETEVYAIATFTIAAICWGCMVWRRQRGTATASHILLLILYLAGASIGNHLLALLAGPAVVAFLWAMIVVEPAADPDQKAVEQAQLAVVAGTWALLIGGGLGSTALMVVGALCYLVALVVAFRARMIPFALVALAVAAVGVTSYLFLYIRSGQHPAINEAQPDNWNALLAVIRRQQYPVRTPWDDPTVLHGPDNSGRTPTMLLLQLVNYLQYYDWQWANGVRKILHIGEVAFPVRTLFTILFTGLGLRGLFYHRRTDRAGWWLLFTLFLTTGLVLMLYMNFKPGFSLGFDLYPRTGDHEVRERDYFFVVSYVVWGLWAGMGLGTLVRTLMERWRVPALLGTGILAFSLLPFAGNFSAASRRHGPDARLAADFAYDLLNTVPPYGVLFTYGDNDTFPLWWAQEVEGVRRDVTVVCLALAQTDWYMRQLRDNPTRSFEESRAPAIWQGRNSKEPDWPAHTLTNEQIGGIRPLALPQDLTIPIGAITKHYPSGTVFMTNDLLVMRVLQQNLGRRPIVWAMTTGRDYQGLDSYVVQQGLGFRLEQALPD
ncbi:MAG TPA: DUF2723 domain-containing protein, partial [Gemmatimonadales bacterium]|nr:DUF2723 domain-containing protein [Gemmatimonadales bacterium]